MPVTAKRVREGGQKKESFRECWVAKLFRDAQAFVSVCCSAV